MLALISPAKKLNTDKSHKCESITQPMFKDDISALLTIMKQKTASDIRQLMGVSDKLAELNFNRYQSFSDVFDRETSSPAVYCFKGDTYVGLQAEGFSNDDLLYAQEHLAILSGLYGLLRPLDLMQPYRLEMGIKLANDNGEDLYQFWQNKITDTILATLRGHQAPYLINLASNEYIKVINKKAFDDKFITCHFKEERAGQLKTIGLFAKRARGTMARYMIANRIETPEALKDFTEDGYQFIADLSDATNYYFVRAQ